MKRDRQIFEWLVLSLLLLFFVLISPGCACVGMAENMPYIRGHDKTAARQYAPCR